MFWSDRNFICKTSNLFETDSGFAIKAIGSAPWIILWATNAFKDRQREIFATRALERYVLESEKKQDRGTVNFWHINDGSGTDFAIKQWQGVIGRFLVEAGPFLASYQGQRALKFFTSYPEGHPKIAPEGWGCSPEFRYLSEERKTGIFEWIWITRTSVLPLAAAANLWTSGLAVWNHLGTNA